MNLQKTILAAAAILMAVFILTLGSSCSFQKDINKTETSTKAESRTEDSLRIESLRRDTSEYLRQLREREYFEAQMNCPEVDTAAIRKVVAGSSVHADSLIKALTQKPTTVEKGADGSVKITGNNIRSVRYVKEKDEKEISRYTSTIQTLLEQQIKTAASVITTTKEKEKHSKGGFLNLPWLWFILILLVGIYLGWRFRGGIKLIDKLNPSNMKNLIIVFIASLLLTSCGRSRNPDNQVMGTEVKQIGWQIVGKDYPPIPLMDTLYKVGPTWQQSNHFAATRGDFFTWELITFWSCVLALFMFIGMGTNLIKWFPDIAPMAKGLISFALLAWILWSAKWQSANIKWNNDVTISKSKYDELMQRDGSIRSFWDSLENGCHIVGGKYDCFKK